jgi:hypothetical protein
MSLSLAVIQPKVGGNAFFFKFLKLTGLIGQVKDAPLFSRRVVEVVQCGLLIHSCSVF